ncbi:MAG: 3-hydroxyacyl-CoA dehydrogenase NAD-binding domain-containing protein [Candidatus Hermodarchaeota archaeon]
MLETNQIKNIAIIGAGVQGHSIAQSALMGNFNKVVLNDLSMELIEKGAKQIKYDIFYGLERLKSRGRLRDGLTPKEIMEKLVKETDLEKAVSSSEFIIEAIPEKIRLKKDLFKNLGKYAPESTVLATNTSTMSITELGKASGREDRVVGMHFFIPIALKLIEITRGANTSDKTVENACDVAQNLYCLRGQRVIHQLEKETPGFIANRIIASCFIYFNWVLDKTIKKGITYEQIDADLTDFAPRGLCYICDIIGLDTVYLVLKYLENTVSPDFTPGKILTDLVKQGNLGRKSGKGFYEWRNSQIPIIDKSKKSGNLNFNVIVAIMLNESCRLLENGIISGYKTIDKIISAGYDIPGPFILGKKRYEEYSKLLEDIAEKCGKQYLKPCNLMKSGSFLKMRK